MDKGRNFAVTVGAVVLLFMFWVGWITFKSPVITEPGEVQLPGADMQRLRSDLTEFISKSLKKERPKSQIVDLNLENPREDGKNIKIPYILTLKDDTQGAESTLRATAMLEKEGDLWKVTKVLPQKEVITYEQSENVTAGPSSEESDH